MRFYPESNLLSSASTTSYLAEISSIIFYDILLLLLIFTVISGVVYIGQVYDCENNTFYRLRSCIWLFS